MEQQSLFLGLSVLTALLAFAYAAYLYLWLKKQSTVNKKIIEVSALIKQGANTHSVRTAHFLLENLCSGKVAVRKIRRRHVFCVSSPDFKSSCLFYNFFLFQKRCHCHAIPR